MSGVFKAIGKVFKKVVKVVKKVAIPALMIGAVVLTGGAALGVLPALGGAGGLLAGLGITGTLSGVIAGAVSMGAIGAVTGGVMSAAGGGSFMKGATKGFLVGAATGGVMGGLGMLGATGNILAPTTEAAKAAAQSGITTNLGNRFTEAAATGVFGQGAATPTATGLLGNAVPSATGTVGQALVQTGVKAGGGLLSSASAPSLITAAGQVISGFAKGAASGDDIRERAMYDAEAERMEYDRTAYNYGYRNIYNKDAKGRVIDSVPTSQEAFYQYGPQTLQSPNAGLLGGMTVPSAAARAPMFQIVNGQVVRV